MLEYRTIKSVQGPLVLVEGVDHAKYGEIVTIRIETTAGKQETRTGQVLETSNGLAVVQLFESTTGIGPGSTTVSFNGALAKLGVSQEMLGHVFDGRGRPLDGAEIIPEKELDVNGSAINPAARTKPNDFVQTGVSAIDCMNSLVRGQKLPIFSASGLPHNELAAQIARQASVRDGGEFAVVFAAMGITNEEANFFKEEFRRTGALKNTALFLNLADDPSVERILTPRMALTLAEYLAFEKNMHVLVIMTDMTNYCEALREIAAARNEVPGRRGYPGYMYTDLASLYERAGKVLGKNGSVTQLPILTMPSDDKTHPIPDLTGYITEGQIALNRGLFQQGIMPPIDVLPSLSRLMGNGVGGKKTRDDHKGVSDQLYAAYATGKDLRDLVAVVGKSALSDRDVQYLDFADAFEKEFIGQGNNNRSIEDTLDLAWRLLAMLPQDELKRVKKEHIKTFGAKAQKK